ncbi:MAG: adenylate/guanylate cyclase domain-containing protein [Spirochaeta sp.]|nr:adenylate/guanylate cyclase domain-containing protein [Spirochaeta sp.]
MDENIIVKYKNLIIQLKKEIMRLTEESQDLRIMYDNTVEHGTLIENDLEETNRMLKILLGSMKKYLAPQLYNSIVKSGDEEVQLSYKRSRLTIFFSDIAGFTQITDMIEPETLSELLNQYLDDMSKIALKYGGTIDKFIGDAMMVFFGDPEFIDDETHARQCVLMAVEMQDKIQILSDEWLARGSPSRLSVRMGINTGFCTVGNFGSENRMDYTIIGGQVNIASRLERIAEENSIYLSNSTYNLIKEMAVVGPPLRITVKGISHPIEVFKLIRLKNEEERTEGRYCIATEGGFVLTPISYDSRYASRLEREKIVQSLETALRNIKKSIEPLSKE